ncbi:MAG: hypothetical protein ACKO48_00180 [Actinomycetota bacterium]
MTSLAAASTAARTRGTSSATARARARRQARTTSGAAMPRVARHTDGSAARDLAYVEEEDLDTLEVGRDSGRKSARRAAPTRRPDQESGSHLRVVPRPNKRRNRATSVTGLVVMLAAFITMVIVFQATIAEQQLRLDALTSDLRLAEVHYDNLRQQRAELMMPGRLREEAVMMGMYQGMSTKFMEVPAEVVAEVMASTAKMNPLFADPSAAIASAGAIAAAQPVETGKP